MTSVNNELQRANKVTVVWDGEGVATGTFYKTKNKLGQLKSDSQEVIDAGFAFPETTLDTDGETQVEATGTDKLEAFKEFLQNNATIFGYFFDPVDRRVEKYPSKYDEDTLAEVARDVVDKAVLKIATGVHKHVEKAIKDGSMEFGELAYDVDCGITGEVTEKYKNESLKYAETTCPVTFTIGDKGVTTDVKVNLVSGQLRKPRELADGIPMTITGLKNLLIDNEVLPQPVKKEDKKVEIEDADTSAEVTPDSSDIVANAEYVEE